VDAWLVLRRGLPSWNGPTPTPPAEYLSAHPRVTRTIYPGLPSHPHHALAGRQMQGFGGLISFDVGSLERSREVLGKVRLMALAESLGGVETLISHPAVMTHASVPKERREMLGITDGLLRVSVGIEDIADLIDDLAQALG
jgi:cystathionine gamma-lyase/homocysteine desulfhydrase